MLYPNDVYIRTLGIDIQTMVHHGTQVIIGVFTIVHYRDKVNILYFLKAIPTFLAFCIVAIALDEIVYLFIKDETFNMFFISRHYRCTLPVLSLIYDKVPYLVFLPIYVCGFMFASFVVNALVVGIMKLIKKYEKNNK